MKPVCTYTHSLCLFTQIIWLTGQQSAGTPLKEYVPTSFLDSGLECRWRYSSCRSQLAEAVATCICTDAGFLSLSTTMFGKTLLILHCHSIGTVVFGRTRLSLASGAAEADMHLLAWRKRVAWCVVVVAARVRLHSLLPQPTYCYHKANGCSGLRQATVNYSTLMQVTHSNNNAQTRDLLYVYNTATGLQKLLNIVLHYSNFSISTSRPWNQ